MTLNVSTLFEKHHYDKKGYRVMSNQFRGEIITKKDLLITTISSYQNISSHEYLHRNCLRLDIKFDTFDSKNVEIGDYSELCMIVKADHINPISYVDSTEKVFTLKENLSNSQYFYYTLMI